MFINFEEIRDFGMKRFDTMAAATTSTARGLQAIAEEATDYSTKSIDENRAFAEKLLRARKLDELVELQSKYAKATYNEFVARTTKLGKLYSDLAQDALKELTADALWPGRASAEARSATKGQSAVAAQKSSAPIK